MSRRNKSGDALLLTCEHGGNQIPDAYAHLFADAQDVLESHRGWDPGALELARHLSKELGRPLLGLTWSRLLVESNRTPTNPRIWSQYTKSLPKDERARILAKWWQPHRTKVEQAVEDGIAKNARLIHVAVHSFTPEMDGVVRNADIGLLYDSRRKSEAEVSRRWGKILHGLNPELRVRYNYPYAGVADGLTTWLRKRHEESRYVGIELEINQAQVASKGWRRLQDQIAESLRQLIP